MVMKVALKELNMGSSELSISFSCSVLNNQRCQCFVYIGVKTEGAAPPQYFGLGACLYFALPKEFAAINFGPAQYIVTSVI